jgi:hypothetical protein
MKFGVREICDVTFKTTADGQKVGSTTFAKAGMPAFFIDTATTSSLEQATTTVYAQGGRGYNRLIAWEGEKTMTFTVEDALISPMGLAVLSGAGLINAAKENERHVHITLAKNVDADGNAKVTLLDVLDELGLSAVDYPSIDICKSDDVPAYGIVIDGSGAGVPMLEGGVSGFISGIQITGTDSVEYDQAITLGLAEDAGGQPVENAIATFAMGADAETAKKYAGTTVKLDFYVLMSSSVTEVTIAPEDFGGFFYIEAQTLFRREDTGKDMAAEIIIPKAKVQSGFTFTMAASGDPSTFTFTIDAFPGYTMFDKTKKVMCVMQVVGADKVGGESTKVHDHSFMGA